MKQSFFNNRSNQNKVMTDEQFEQIVGAILAGKYSWACLLILRFAGYNPLHYIPYRTYNRLIKENCLRDNASKTPEVSKDDREEAIPNQSNHLLKINDLGYFKDLERQERNISGGFRLNWLR